MKLPKLNEEVTLYFYLHLYSETLHCFQNIVAQGIFKAKNLNWDNVSQNSGIGGSEAFFMIFQ